MPFVVLVQATRKPGTSPAHFRQHWEERHVPLIKSIVGADFPSSHTRHYIQRMEKPEGGGSSANYTTPAAVIMGTQEDFDYDGFALLTFEDEAAFHAFGAKVNAPEAAAKLAEDEEIFLDRSKLKVVLIGKVSSTT